MEKTKALKILRLARRHGADWELVCKLLTTASRGTHGRDAGCDAAVAVISKSGEMTPEVFSTAFAAARRKVPVRASKSKKPGRLS
ncbi:MAG TPA: hypothetical protein VMM36_06865 [Opitutaceae bacterium]|nr:hypothetical protein [Opitutaceae bacterium]